MSASAMLLWLNALVFIGYGLACAVVPALMAELATGVIPASSSAMTDMRATYGGMMVGIGLMLALCSSQAPRLGLWALLFIMLGMACARSLGMLIDGSPNQFMVVFLIAEISVAIVAVWLLLKADFTDS